MSEGARAGKFQNLKYGYDPVGNILSLNNNVDVPAPNTFGGPNSQTFKYDDLYRLVHGDGEYKFAPDKKRNYTLDLSYDTNHNILRKVQTDKITTPDGSIVPQKGTSYAWDYSYDEKGHPHAPTHIGNRSFEYDLNGNQRNWQSDLNGTRRYIQWDEENRIAEIDDNGHRNKYVYDAAGERVIKTTQQGETVYVNQYYVVRNRSVVSKHLYAGSSRLVSHLVMGTAPGNEDRGAPGNGHGSDNTPSLPDNGNGPVDKGNNGNKEHINNGLHLGQLKNGTMDKVNPGQGRERRSDTANQHAQDIYKNPTLTGNFPGQGINNRSARANGVAKNTSRNPNLVISEAGASVELGGDISGGETTGDTGSSYVVNGQSEFIWYYHPDHLGSTGFVTDANGELYEHVEYFPFGETWVQEHSNTQRTPYLYTGKELDEETQLYYYGARYYDPRTSVWQSADPILGSYLNGKPNGGVHKSLNLELYAYAHQNPLRFVDPDGQSPASVVIKQIAKKGVKEGIEHQAQKMINQRLGKYMSDSMKKEFFDDLKGVVDSLDDSWWEIGLELVPVAGDIYGGVKGADKLKKAYDAYQDLENKYVDKIAGSLKGVDKEKFIENMRKLGVGDSKKDHKAMGTPYKTGDQGHHKKDVSRNPDYMTDPRYIEKQDFDTHLNKGHNGSFHNAPSDQTMNSAYQ